MLAADGGPRDEAPARRRELADVPRLLRPAAGHVDGERAADQRRVRVHVDVHQRAQGAAPRRGARRVRPSRADVPPRGRRDVQGQPRRRARTRCASRWASCARCCRCSAWRRASSPGWEADDIIATVVEQAVGRGDDVLIVTGDRDAYQLVQDPHIRVLYNRRGVSDYALYDEAGIIERTGVTPAQYPEYAAMRGDPSDNLPGVPGVGEKTAAKLIQTYGGLDGIFENVDKQTPKLRASLAEHEERVRKNHEIMILRRDAPIELPESLVHEAGHGRGPAAVRLPRVPDVRRAPRRGPRAGRRRARRAHEREQLVAEVSVSSVARPSRPRRCPSLAAVALAGSWEGEAGRSPLVGLAVVTDADAGRGDVDPGRPPRRRRRRRRPRRRPVQAHDAKALMRTLLAPSAADRPRRPGPRHRHRRLPARPGRGPLPARPTWSSATPASPWRPTSRPPRASSTSTARQAEPPTIAGREALAVHQLVEPIMTRLADDGMAELYATIENPLVRVLARMEHVGVAVDVENLRELHARLTAEVQRLGVELKVGRRARRPQHQLADPAARDPLRRAARRSRADADQEDEDRRLHRRRDAGEVAAGMAGVHRAAAAVPRGREAARHLRRGPARRDRPRRAHPRHVQPDRRPHRAAQLGPPEPPQHPGATGRGTAVPQGVHGRAGRQAAGRRLQPDRAALHRPPRRRSRV